MKLKELLPDGVSPEIEAIASDLAQRDFSFTVVPPWQLFVAACVVWCTREVWKLREREAGPR